MTTLHEEPSKAIAEHPEESYSDPEYPEYESFETKRTPKTKNFSRMSTSKTMSALTEMTSTSNMLAYTSSANTALKHIVGTPSMSSSASSGYGSQVSIYFKKNIFSLVWLNVVLAKGCVVQQLKLRRLIVAVLVKRRRDIR